MIRFLLVLIKTCCFKPPPSSRLAKLCDVSGTSNRRRSQRVMRYFTRVGDIAKTWAVVLLPGSDGRSIMPKSFIPGTALLRLFRRGLCADAIPGATAFLPYRQLWLPEYAVTAKIAVTAYRSPPNESVNTLFTLFPLLFFVLCI